jgi:YidC/Oxa1 family membrane protein insertase
MEQARLLIAIVLSLAVFLVWNYFFVEPQMPPQKDDQQLRTNAQNSQEKPAVKPQKESIRSDSKGSNDIISNNIKSLPDTKGEPARTITIDNSKYTVKISEEGAGIVSFALKEYFENIKPDAKRKELLTQQQDLNSMALFFENQSLKNLDKAKFHAMTDSEKIKIKNQKFQLSFIKNTAEGIQIKKTFTFQPESYLIDLDVIIQNNSNNILSDQLGLRLSNSRDVSKNSSSYAFEGPSALVDEKLKQVKIKKDNPPDIIKGKIQWIALEDRYFMTSLIAKEPFKSSMRIKIDQGKLLNEYIGPKFEIGNGSSKHFKYAIFFGPKKQDLLEKLNYSLSQVIHFGFFDFLAKPFLWFLNFIFSIIPNYGVSIIILTILTKILLWPLGNKSYKSMNQMKRLQPLMQEIREKYKNDKTKMNQEMMGLYRTYKINPLGGCLPMILQIPVFFALYRMLYQAIELRHAPFIWWINDLSAPDRLFHFDFSIPMMQPPYGIPVLTIIMGASMLLQQKMSPPPGDPTQAKMMMIMPIVFTFIFINFSSGLVLYWLINNLLSIGQQYYIQKKYA